MRQLLDIGNRGRLHIQNGNARAILGDMTALTAVLATGAVLLAAAIAVFSARPGCIKEVIAIDEPHPRKPSFMTAPKFHALRDQLYGLLHDEIRKSMSESAQSRRRYGEAAAASGGGS